jgi:hypothetical protein
MESMGRREKGRRRGRRGRVGGVFMGEIGEFGGTVGWGKFNGAQITVENADTVLKAQSVKMKSIKRMLAILH